MQYTEDLAFIKQNDGTYDFELNDAGTIITIPREISVAIEILLGFGRANKNLIAEQPKRQGTLMSYINGIERASTSWLFYLESNPTSSNASNIVNEFRKKMGELYNNGVLSQKVNITNIELSGTGFNITLQADGIVTIITI